ncbi:MAG: YlbF family regulator [Caldilinea sp.]
MATQTTDLTLEVQQALDAFAENLLASEPFVHYDDCGERMMRDATAQSLWRQLRQMEGHLRATQANGEASADDISAYRQLYAAAKANPVIAEFWQAQSALQESLQVANREISVVLGADFARLARRSGCCS